MADQNSKEDAQLLAALKLSAEQQLGFYSNAGKAERERWIVQEFLRLRSIIFDPGEIFSEEQQSKIDVTFRDLCFQVKEITEPNSRRHAEIRESYRIAMAANSLADLVGSGFVYDNLAPASGYQLVCEQAQQLAQDERYALVKSEIDLLIYVTRTCTSLVNLSEINLGDLEQTGWRSISVLIGQQALVLYGGLSAPLMLRHLPE